MDNFNKLDSIVQKFYSDYDLLSKYIDFNFEESNGRDYKKYKKIVYPSLINYMYVGFEHHIKQLYILLYKHLKDNENFEFDTQYFSLKDIPAYVSENFIIQDNRLSLNMTEDVISYTKQNMSADTINDLFKRLRITNIFSGVDTLDTKKYQYLSATGTGIRGYLKYFITQRNICSHGLIDDYMSKPDLDEWLIFLTDCYNKILTSITHLIFSDSNLSTSIDIKNAYKNNNIICFDNNQNLDITRESVLCYKLDERYFFYRINNIQSKSLEIDSTKNNVEIGLEISAYYENIFPNKNKKIFILSYT